MHLRWVVSYTKCAAASRCSVPVGVGVGGWVPQSCPPFCFGGGSLGAKNRKRNLRAGKSRISREKKKKVGSTHRRSCAVSTLPRGVNFRLVSFQFFPNSSSFFVSSLLTWFHETQNGDHRTCWWGPIPPHDFYSPLPKRPKKKKKKNSVLEKGRKKEICPPPNTIKHTTREVRRFPVWGSPPRRHRVASRQVKDNALDVLIVVHTGGSVWRITTLEYSVRGFTPQGILHTQHSGRAGGIHTYTQHTLERLTHTPTARERF